MNTPKIEVCKNICNECGFTGATKDTLYADFYDILKGIYNDDNSR